MPTDLDEGSLPNPAPARTSTKRLHAQPLSCNLLIINDNASANTIVTEVPVGASKAKKLKMTPGQHAMGASGLQTDISIISIDDVDDLQTERLNKTNPTADIKEFFSVMPCVPGQDKVRMQCKLCV